MKLKESEKLELKKSTSELKEAVISIAAVLNKHQSGELYFGISNDGTAIGQTVAGKTIRDVSKAISEQRRLAAIVNLKDFVIPNTELIPDEVRSKIKKWSDYIDYWAVDWDFQNDTFMQGWVTYRTRKDRTLALTSDSHVYEKPGTYRVLVKVVDIFGNDTTQGFEVEAK